MHGFLNIDKPAGMTSHDVVARVRRLARQKRVGHAGTLDPAATGVLVLALGQATRLIEYVQEEGSKRYLATVCLGATTSTDDAEGEVLATAAVPAFSQAAIEQALQRFRGPILQVPPMYSALHHQGQRLHELARAGLVVERAARAVTIERLTLLDCALPLLTLDVMCSKGTYIRSLARDLGDALGCGAHLQALRRTAVGAFTIEQALSLAQVEEMSDNFMSILLPPDRALERWSCVHLGAEQAQQIRNGQLIALAGQAAERLCAYGPDGALLALLTPAPGGWKPDKVFDWSA